MQVSKEETIAWLNELPNKVRWAIIDAANEADRVDILGTLKSAESRVASERQLAMTEIEKGTKGEIFVVEQGRVGVRSFNSMSLLAKFADRMGVSLLQAIGSLRDQGVLEIKWKWTPFKEAAREYGVEYSTIQREVTDGDEFDVGEIWKNGYPSFKAINKED